MDKPSPAAQAFNERLYRERQGRLAAQTPALRPQERRERAERERARQELEEERR